jgi:hypothetical protein
VVVAERGKSGGGKREKEINHDRSGNLYENKQNDDNLPGKKVTFLQNKTTFYAKAQVFCGNPLFFLTLLEHWGTNPAV